MTQLDALILATFVASSVIGVCVIIRMHLQEVKKMVEESEVKSVRSEVGMTKLFSHKGEIQKDRQ